MKTLLIIVGGLGLAVVMLMTGAVGATIFFSAEPEKILNAQSSDPEVWVSKPERIDVVAQDFERLPARVVLSSGASTGAASPELIDGAQASNRPADPILEKLEGSEEASAAHIAWCENRYRSYSADDNTYTSYRGVKRQCQSPYGHETAKPTSPLETSEPIIEASLTTEYQPVATARLPMEHVRSCLSRYRSYRPEDNSYQPFSGGPRRQCY